MARRKSVQLKAGGRGGGPPCGALEQIVGHTYEATPPSRYDFGFKTKKSSPSRYDFVTETWANFFFARGGRGNAFPTLPHAPQCIPDVRNHYLKITPNLPPASCSSAGSVTILDRPGANRHLSVPCRLSSRRTRGGLRHIQKLFAAGGVEDDDALGGRAPRPPPPAAGGTLRPAPTRRPEVGSEGAGRIVPRAARPRRRTQPIDRARRIPPCEARIEGACKAKERCLTRSTLPSGKISWASCSRTGCKRAHGGRALVSDALRVQCDDYMEAMQHYLNIRSPGVSTRS